MNKQKSNGTILVDLAIVQNISEYRLQSWNCFYEIICSLEINFNLGIPSTHFHTYNRRHHLQTSQIFPFEISYGFFRTMFPSPFTENTTSLWETPASICAHCRMDMMDLAAAMPFEAIKIRRKASLNVGQSWGLNSVSWQGVCCWITKKNESLVTR